MSYGCDPRLPSSACANDIFVKVKNFSPITNTPSYPAQIKVPVKQTVINITEPLMDTIFIEEGFEDVKSIQRKVILTQCHVTKNFLYVEGYILKNVGYAVPIYNDDPESCHGECKVIKNDYRDLTARLDFHFTTAITVPGLVPNPAKQEGSFFVDCMKPCDCGSAGELHCEKFYHQEVVLNEPFTCELEGYAIDESVILKKDYCESPWRYDTILEKLELSLEIAILQTKQLPIPGPTPTPGQGIITGWAAYGATPTRIPNLPVILLDDDKTTVLATTTTNATGDYVFANLPVGTYYVQFPSTYTDASGTVHVLTTPSPNPGGPFASNNNLINTGTNALYN